MIKKIILSVFLFLFLTNCGFTPLYSNKEINDINFEVLNYEGDRDINLNLVSKLRANSNPKGKIYKVKIITNYEKITLTNNLAGEPEEYQLGSDVEFTVIENNLEKKFKLCLPLLGHSCHGLSTIIALCHEVCAENKSQYFMP